MDKSEIPRSVLSQPFVLRIGDPPNTIKPAAPLRAGEPCPVCGRAALDYDGLINLVCPQCGFSGGGGCNT